MEYTFTLKYQLADEDRDSNALVERLGEAGCSDALVGIGQPGRLELEFTREAEGAEEAIRSALTEVRRAVPTARLIEVTPDQVGLTDLAEMVGGKHRRVRLADLMKYKQLCHPVSEQALTELAEQAQELRLGYE